MTVPSNLVSRQWRWRFAHVLAALALIALHGHAQPAWAHEGHAPLPSNGASVNGDRLLLSKAAIKAVDLKLHTVSIGTIRQQLQVNAHVALPPLRRAKVATLMSGRIKTVRVKPGVSVAKGAVLASVESLELESLQVDLLKIDAELELLEKRASQLKDLADAGGIPGTVYLEAESKLRKKRAEYEIVKRKLAGWGMDAKSIARVLKTGETVGAISLTSPMAGVVEHVGAEPGQLVQSTDHLFDIVDRSTVYLIGEVLEADAHLVKPGAPVTVTFAGLPDEVFSGRISHQHLHLHLPQRAIHVVVPISNSNGRLRPGMFGRMTITIAEAKNEIVCPSSVLIETGSRSFVLKRADEGKFKLQPVEVGMRSRTQVVIKSGLFPGQQIISRGTYLLASMFDGHELLRDAKTAGAAGKPGPRSTYSPGSTERLASARAVVEIPIGQRALVTSLIEGWIVEIPNGSKQPLYEGAPVEKGQVLARIRSQKLRSMQLELLQANASLKWTQDEVARLKPVAKTGGVAAKDLWQREVELKMLRAQIASLKRQLLMIGLSEKHLKALLEVDLTRPMNDSQDPGVDPIVDAIEVRAPISGRLSRFSVSPGELVHAHDKLFEIQDTGEVWIKAYYFEKDASRIAVGQEATVTFPANPALRLQGKVVRIAPQLASKDRVLPVWIEVSNPGHFLKEGMLAEVTVRVPSHPSTLAARKGGK